MLKLNLPTKLGLVLMSAACLGTLSQVPVPWFVKPFVLLLPLQTAALAYVIWYWRERSQSPSPQD